MLIDSSRQEPPDPTVALSRDIAVPTHLRFHDVAERHRDMTALVGIDRTLSYGGLAEEVAEAVSLLRHVGVEPSQVVAIDARRDADVAVAILAVWSADAAILVLDPTYPPSWRDHLLDAVRPAALIGCRGDGGSSGPMTIAAMARPRDFREVAGPDLAYVASTSGTTGRPRMILGGHQPLAHFLDWQRRAFGIGPGARIAMLSGLAHDPLLRDIFAPLTSGGTLVVPADAALRDPALLGRWLLDQAVDHVHWTPSLAGALVAGWDAELPALRRVFFGGEPLLPERAKAVRRLAPNADLLNFYGATETPQGVSCGRVLASETVPLGAGIPGVQILVVDQHGRALDIGTLGEIGVRSPYLAQGYLDDPVETRARFVRNPATGYGDDRIYLTGDLGRARADGRVDFVGRADRQIKRGGVRIELSAIEDRALSHPTIRAAAAISIADRDGLLVLFVVGGYPDMPADLAEWLADGLPRALCPDRICRVDAIPLTPSGKTDWLALAQTFEADLDIGASHSSVHTNLRTLERLACRVLGLATIASEDDLLSIGMHSLRALSLLAEIGRAFAVKVTVPELRENPTLRALDGLISRRTPATSSTARPATGALPASPAQSSLWLAERIGGRQAALHIPIVLELRGPLEDAALAAHVAALQRRHPALRTILRTSNDGLDQAVLDAVVELSVESCPENALRMRSEALICERFDLEAGPLHRPCLLRATSDHAVLVWTFHHCIFDGASRRLLVQELAALLEGADLPDSPSVSCDFARKASRIDREGDSVARSYATRVAGLAPLHLALFDEGEEGFCEFELGPATTAMMHRLAGETRTTPFAVSLAVYELLLARLTGIRSFAVGAPRSMRDTSNDRMLGCFVDMMVMRADVDLSLTFAAHLRRVIGELATSLEEGAVPMEKLQAELRRTDRSLPAPCEAVLVFEDARADLSAGGMRLRELDWWKDRLRYGIELHLWPTAEGFGGRLLHDTSFGRERAAWFVDAFGRSLERCCGDPTLVLEDCPLDTTQQRERVIALGGSPDPAATPIPLIQAIDAHAKCAPDRIAVRFRDRELSYRELVSRSNALTQDIVDRGVTPGDRVAILLPQGFERIIAALAVLRAGASYVPLEDDEAQERRGYILADACPVLAISDRPCGAIPRITVGSARADAAPRVVVASGSDAYLIYTSGSTGRPKGVRVSRANLDRLFAACENWLQSGPDDVWACCHSFAFDFSVWEIWGALRHGGCIALSAREDVRDPRALLAFVAREKVTILSQTPSSFGQVVAADAEGTHDLSALRLVVFGGEALHPRVLKPWIKRRGDARPALVNMFGITETTVHATRRRITARDLASRGSPIGRAIADMAVRVLDTAGQPTPIGLPGEIHVAGAGVTGGYLNQPALTAERFVPDPWSEIPGSRLYRSGDQGILMADGDVLYRGRLDNQVQLRGVRLELGEVEAAILSHPGVGAAAALVHSAAEADDRLIVYFSAAVGARIVDDRQLARHVASRLPGGAKAQLIQVDALPLTANGKIDRTALAARRHVQSNTSRGSFGARSLVETIVVDTFRDVLDLDELPGDADFFASGGHSLLAMRMIARLRAVLGVDLPLTALFESPTISGVARAAQLALDFSGAVSLEPIVPFGGTTPPPASFAQQRIWFAHQQDRGLANSYNSRLNLEIIGPLDRVALERAASAVVARHEPLRTCLSRQDGEVLQHVQPAATVPFRFEDLSDLDAVGRHAELELLKDRHYAARFDLETDLMVRFCLVRVASEHHLLLTTFHHCAYDGRSSQIFLAEVAHDYDAFSRGLAQIKPSLPLRYADYAAWERSRAHDDALQAKITARSRFLRGVKPFRLPAEPDASPGSTSTGRVERTLSASLCAKAAALARNSNATVFMVLLSAMKLLLHQLSGESEITLCIASANRSRGELNDLIGMFVNLLTVTTEITPSLRFADLLGSVRSATLDALDSQDVPFEHLVEAVNPERRSADAPLVQVVAAFHPWAECASFSVGDVRFCALPESDSQARFDLEFHVWPAEGGALLMRTVYGKARFSERAIGLYLDRLETIMDTFFHDPDSSIETMPTAAADPKQASAGAAPTLPHTTIVALFDARTAEDPDRHAVIEGHGYWSYARLQLMSQRIARRLQDAGVKVGDIVAVASPRSAWVVAAMIGILRAGAAYLAIDPDTPADWQVRQLRHASLALVAEDIELAGVALKLALAEESFPAASPWPVEIGHEDLAYVSFTSGSTGEPHGVMIPHRGILHLVTDMHYAPIRRGDRVAHVAALSFDATTFELWGALAHGATIVVVSRDTALDPDRFAAVIREGFGAMFLTTSLFNRLAEEVPDCFDHVRTLLVGGEAADGRLLERVHPARLGNAYGPTECTTFATWQAVGSSPGPKVPIGLPLPFVQAHVLDASMRVMDAGVAGELYIGGAGVAWGYLGDPRRTAERFAPDPLTTRPGARLYRTGDRVRHDSDGVLDFLGRVDRQVKIRGFRIEPAAIEAELRQHPDVSRAIVTVSDDEHGQRLAAFVVPRDAQDPDGVAAWAAVFDEKVYGLASETSDPLFDTRGWLDSRTGQPIPEPDMRDWAEDIARAALARAPRRVLDIGCGLGIHLFRLAPLVEHYHATDISQAALDDVAARLPLLGTSAERVSLSCCGAHQIEEVVTGEFDLIQIVSVAQYFPSLAYLRRVIEAAARRLSPGGTILIGDVRSLPLLRTFHSWVVSASAALGQSAWQQRTEVERRLATERELAIDPRFFEACVEEIPGLTGLRLALSRGGEINELTLFRYTAELRAGAPQRSDFVVEDGSSLGSEDVRRRLAQQPRLLLRDIPNLPVARVLSDELRQFPELGRPRSEGLDRGTMQRLAAEHGREIELSWPASGARDRIDAAFFPEGEALTLPHGRSAPAGALANRPIDPSLASRLRDFLAARLPAYALPSGIMVVNQIPLTPTGKIDRAALRGWASVNESEARGAADGALEELLCVLWAETLGRARTGPEDNFFELGGHSLLAIRLVERLRSTFGSKMPLGWVFEHPTPRLMANALERGDAVAGETLVHAQAALRLSRLPDEDTAEALAAQHQARGFAADGRRG